MSETDRVYNAIVSAQIKLAHAEAAFSHQDGQVCVFKEDGYVKQGDKYVTGIGISFGPSKTGPGSEEHLFANAHLSIAQAEILLNLLALALDEAINEATAESKKEK